MNPAQPPSQRVESLALVEWVRALEEEDAVDTFIASSAREQASRRAFSEQGFDPSGPTDQDPTLDPLKFFADRAQQLVQEAGSGSQAALATRIALSPGKRAFVIALLLSFLVGFAADRWAGGGQMDLLASPLALLLLLNGLLYLARLVGALFPRGKSAEGGGTFAGLLRSISEWRARSSFPANQADPKRQWEQRSFARFLDGWTRKCGRLLSTRLRCLLDFSAAALLLGTLLGLYSRGFTRAFKASWESTWLSPETVDQLLRLILAPAATLLRVNVPDATLLQESPGPAAEWIHLYAVTAALFVLIPRCVLGLAGALRARTLEAALAHEWDAPYYRRILQRGQDRGRAVLLPYSHQPRSAMLERFIHELGDTLGARTVVDVAPVTAYGDPAPAPAAKDARWKILLFNISQTAEIEVHAEWVADIVSDSDSASVWIVLDPGPYQKTVNAPNRVRDRLAGWRTVLGELGLPILTLPTDWTDPNARRELKAALADATTQARLRR